MSNLIGKSGNPMEVTKAGRGLVDAKSEFLQASMRGDAFSWCGETKAATAADTVWMIRNDHPTKNLHFYEMTIKQDSSTVEAELHRVTAAYTSAGTAVVGVNLNGASGKVAQASAISDETGNTQGTVVRRFFLSTSEYTLDMESAVIAAPGQAIGLDLTVGGSQCYWSVIGYFKNPDEL